MNLDPDLREWLQRRIAAELRASDMRRRERAEAPQCTLAFREDYTAADCDFLRSMRIDPEK